MRVSRDLFRHAKPIVLVVIFVATSVDLCAQENDSRGIAFLKEIEQRVLPLPLVPGVARHESLPAFYSSANLTLRHRLDEAARAFTSGKPKRFQAMTVVAGPAGVGKTFTKKSVYGSWVPADQVWKLDVREMFEEMADEGFAESKPDVYHGQLVISRMLSLTPQGREEFVRRFNERAASFTVVDSIDEVHPDDYFFILDTLERLALHSERSFIHVVVFGRPLAFSEYWRDRLSEGLPNGLRGFMLNPPDFRTTGDLLVSNWNYDCWKHKLCCNDSGNHRSMTWPEYREWCGSNFDRSGEFAGVTFTENNNMTTVARQRLSMWTSEQPTVMAVLPNLAGNGILRDIVAEWAAEERSFDERAFMEEFFAKWLERDTKTGDRPSRLKPQHLELYLRLLEEVAAKYVKEHRVNQAGYFDVDDNDRVIVEHEGEVFSVLVRRLLNRSGMVTLDPMLAGTARYRFEPFWIHRHLLTKHDERLRKLPPHTRSVISANIR